MRMMRWAMRRSRSSSLCSAKKAALAICCFVGRPRAFVVEAGDFGVEDGDVFGEEGAADQLHQLRPGRVVQVEAQDSAT